MGDGTPDPGTPPAEPRQKTRVPLFVTLILTALLLYCASAGPAIYLAVIAHRNVARGDWVERAYFTVYRPHLDLCYRQEGYFRYLDWFIVKAGGNTRTHAQFKEFWEVEAGYRKPAGP
jgi:hypothetical protein